MYTIYHIQHDHESIIHMLNIPLDPTDKLSALKIQLKMELPSPLAKYIISHIPLPHSRSKKAPMSSWTDILHNKCITPL